MVIAYHKCFFDMPKYPCWYNEWKLPKLAKQHNVLHKNDILLTFQPSWECQFVDGDIFAVNTYLSKHMETPKIEQSDLVVKNRAICSWMEQLQVTSNILSAQSALICWQHLALTHQHLCTLNIIFCELL